MKMLLTPFIVTTLLLSAGAADRCGDRCTSTQVCTDDGICVNKSELVKCGAWTLSYYCHKGHECCGYQGCMPVGDVCCGSFFYCPSGNTCCGTMYCCKAGTFCDGNGNCVLDKYSTRKPSTTRSIETRTPSKTARTLYPTRARTPFPTESRTRYPTFRTTRWFNDYTTRSSFRISHTSTSRWLYGVIIGGVVVTVAIIIAVVIWNRRNSASNALMSSAGAVDRCGDRCTSTQVCTDDGICVNRTDMVKCGAWPSSYYCQKGQDCCGFNGCMPAGAVCCGSIFYCPSGHTCCGAMICCKAGTFCDGNGNCVLDKYSTRKPNGTRTPFKTARTLYPTTRARTLFPNKTTRWYYNDHTTRSSFRVSHTSTLRWLYGVIIGVVVTVVIIIAAVIWNCRNSASNAPGHPGTGGMVLTSPAQIYGQSPGNNMPRQPPK